MPTLDHNQIQTRVPLYQKWVVLELIGTYGRNQSDVVSRILGEWIAENEEFLAKRGLAEKDFKRPRPVPATESDGAERRLKRRAANGEPDP